MNNLREIEEVSVSDTRTLTTEDKNLLEKQNSRKITDFQARQLEVEAQKNWDLFYKRNETRFFKDRHWTTREFEELIGSNDIVGRRYMLEVGCGVGNLVFPLIERNLDIFVYACDFSPRAVDFVKANKKYNDKYMKAFYADITTDTVFSEISRGSLDIITMVFVLSAIHPDKFICTLRTLFSLLQPGGIFLFRDYGVYDMTQFRFKSGSKIDENFYVRQDGTRTYFFSIEKLRELFKTVGFEIQNIAHIHRRTVNKKEGIDVPRIFVQAKLKKPMG